MRNGIALAASALVLAVSATSATAQVPPDYEVRELKRGDVDIIRAARPFADCLIAQKAEGIPKYLGSLAPKNEWLARDMRKAHPECPAPKNLGPDATTFLQTALFEAMIKRDLGNATSPANFNHLPPFLYVKSTDSDWAREWFANLIEPYDCASRREPSMVRALLATQPVSAEEGVAFGNLKSTLVVCQPRGEKWEMRAYFARRYLAETYYTLMKVDQRGKAGVQ